MNKLFVALLTGGMMSLSQLHAQEKPVKKPKLTSEQKFSKIDKNKDGFIQIAELKKAEEKEKVTTHFKKLDLNADSKVSKEEFVKYESAKYAKKEAKINAEKNKPKLTDEEKFAKKDLNHDGVVTLNEVKSGKSKGQQSKFKKMDLNKDGKLSKEEFLTAKKTQETNKIQKNIEKNN